LTSIEAERARLTVRLAHRLGSTLLLVREAADRGDQELLREQLDEAGRRARGLARCCALGSDAAAALRDALGEWMGPAARWEESAAGFEVLAPGGVTATETPELGEPLVRLLAAEAGIEVVSWSAERVVIRA
jgi:hypothetical protein